MGKFGSVELGVNAVEESTGGVAGSRWQPRGSCTGLRTLMAVALLTGAAGCAVGPDFVTPPAPVAPTWLEWRNKALNTRDERYHNWWLVSFVIRRSIG
jgi:hypothetical protein